MSRRGVVFTPEAEEQIAELYWYIEENASAEVALRYTTAIVDYCEGLETFPERGTPRDDIRPGLRTTSYKRRTEIAYTVDDGRVEIIGVFPLPKTSSSEDAPWSSRSPQRKMSSSDAARVVS